MHVGERSHKDPFIPPPLLIILPGILDGASHSLTAPPSLPCSPVFTIAEARLLLFGVARPSGQRWLPGVISVGVEERRPLWTTKQLRTTKPVPYHWTEADLTKKIASKAQRLKGKCIRRDFSSDRMHCLITLNSPLSLPEFCFVLFFFGNNLLTSLRPQLIASHANCQML